MALFKSYPCVGDLTVPLALLPLWSHTFRCKCIMQSCDSLVPRPFQHLQRFTRNVENAGNEASHVTVQEGITGFLLEGGGRALAPYYVVLSPPIQISATLWLFW